MKKIAVGTFVMLSVLLGSGCKQDSPTLPLSELILGHWKWYSQGIKVVSAAGEALEVDNLYYLPGAYAEFKIENTNKMVVLSKDGIDTEFGPWELNESKNEIKIIDTNFKILRLDKEYLILSYDYINPDPNITDVFRYTFIFKR